jgi:hypothetical protein
MVICFGENKAREDVGKSRGARVHFQHGVRSPKKQQFAQRKCYVDIGWVVRGVSWLTQQEYKTLKSETT